MKLSKGLFLQCCAFALLAAMPRAAAWGQGMEPAVSPEPSPAAAVSPAASPAADASPIAAPSPEAVVSGTAPILTGIAPAMTGTAAAVSGTGMAAVPSPTPPSPYSVEIDLGNQRAYLLKDGHKVATSAISSGRAGHLTPTGNFAVIEKDLNHFSNLYGSIVSTESGRLVKAGADSAMPVPKGCKFVPAPMKWFMRFDGAAGMHAGILPGYAASHGCVRMPAAKAELFYETVEVGTPVHVFGTPPERASGGGESHGHVAAAATPKATPTPRPGPTPRPPHGRWWF